MRGVLSSRPLRTGARITTEQRATTSAWSACTGACLTDEQVLDFVEGKLDRRNIEYVDAHLNACTSCGELIIEVLQAETGRLPSEHAARTGCWTFEPGSKVAERYVVGRALGRGGMGEVYEAVELALQRPVALKTTRAAKSDQVDAVDRLCTEFTVARRVCHPHVCRMHGVGVHRDNGPCGTWLGLLIMELIDGKSIAQHLSSGALDSEQVLCIARGLFAGLAAIHDAGIIHRDIKSQNLMLRSRATPERLVIIDFGLAVNATHEHSMRGSSRTSLLEGSPGYMAPEQIRGMEVTPAVDIFAGGVVLYEALTGTLPFRSLRTAKGRVSRDPEELPARVRELRPNVSRQLERLVMRCLEVDCTRRYASARQALTDLDR